MSQFVSFILTFLWLTTTCLAQTNQSDSLNILLEKETSTDEKIQLFIELAKHSEDDKQIDEYLLNAESLISSFSKEEKAKVLDKIGDTYYRKKQYEKAVEKIEQGLTLWEELGMNKQMAESCMNLGKSHRKLMSIDLAISAYATAEGYYQEANDLEGVIESLNKRGIIFKNLDNYVDALPLYYKAYDLARRNGLHVKLAATCVNIGVVLKKQKKYEDALDYYWRAKDIYEIDENYSGLANIYNNIGSVNRLQKDYDEALKNYDLAIEFRKKSDQLDRLSYTYNNIGVVYMEQKEYDLALENFRIAEQKKIDCEDFESLKSTYYNFSEVYLELNDKKNYTYYADLTEKMALKYNDFDLLRGIYVFNGNFEANNGDYKRAYAYLAGVINELDTLDEKSQNVLTSVLQAHFDNRQNQSEIDELYEVNDTLTGENNLLEKSRSRSYNLVWAMSILLVILIIITVMLFYNQKAYASKSKELLEANEQLRQTMIGKEEKETLLKEIHHRVKNNLQIIKSLIRLQNSGKDERMHEILLDFEQRVSAMALVHESLYKSGDLANVNVTEYYESLINDLIEAYSLKLEMETEVSIDIENLGIDTLVPLGLLTNEIISNSLKHGFDTGSNGIIKVDLRRIDNEYYQLYIGDNGKGFDFTEELNKSNSLGGELIEALVEQLDGSYEFINDNGSYYRIKFKPQDKKGTR